MAAKKALRIVQDPHSTCVLIQWEGGGELPAELGGVFTNAKVAKSFIARWQDVNRDEAVEVNDKTLPKEKALPKQQKNFEPL